ncbi:MAG: acyclic terpene utilization AtuA family protein, partial [Chloroflexi bacterium]|nr:acyclic terpene utilization AtuA family protein [Chloroflexota bacterium]
EQAGPDRVRVSGTRGTAPPATLKALVAYGDGWLAEGYVSFAWPRAEAKARRAAEIIQARLGDVPGLAELRCDLLGVSALLGPLAPPVAGEHPEVTLRVVARGASESAVGRLLQEFYPLYVAGPPGASGIVLPPPREIVGVWPTLVPRDAVSCRVEVREVQ